VTTESNWKMLALILLSLIIPDLSSADLKVVGGGNANIANHPWQVSLRNANSHTCGAVLISGTRAITAAHCGGSATSSYSVLAGTTDRTVQTCADCALRNPVTGFVRHPLFANNPSAGYPNDIAVIWFYNIAKNSNIDYVVMTMAGDGTMEGAVCSISGWGRTMAGGPLPTTLQQGMLTVIPNADCITTWGANRIRPEQMCAQGSTTSVCGGDNGGPLVCGGKLAGIWSWGEANCSPQYPSVFIRISSYYDWITENL